MTHAEFVDAYTHGKLKVEIDPPGAARFLSARLLLPLVMMPVLGLGVGLVLAGWIFTGLGIVAIGFIAPRLIKRSAPHFILTQSLQDAAIYDEVVRSGILRTVPLTGLVEASPQSQQGRGGK